MMTATVVRIQAAGASTTPIGTSSSLTGLSTTSPHRRSSSSTSLHRASLGLRHSLRTAESGSRSRSASAGSSTPAGRTDAVLMYAGIESGMVTARDTDDWSNSVIAGLGTGIPVQVRQRIGPRSATIAGVIGGFMAGAAITGIQF